MKGSALLTLYRASTSGLSFLAPALLSWRKRNGKEDAQRLEERYGHASRERPPGPLVWLHGASVGEAIALLPLIEALRARGVQTLLTTGTVTSASLMQSRLPPGAIHQYVPLDAPRPVQRFLDHWLPDIVLLAESELWPNMIFETAQRNIPIALVNARLSARSAARWKKFPSAISSLLSGIDVTLAQTHDDASRFMDLGAPRVMVSGNLKYDVPALPCDPLELSQIRARIGARPVWLAASTHDGEEDIAMSVHVQLAQRWPGLITMIVPRHPDRGAAIADLAARQGIAAKLRSRGEDIPVEGGIYIADTIGELGLFYRAAGIVFVGRSLGRHGGQNPIEPAKLASAILHGPHVANFADVYRELDTAGGAAEVADLQGLSNTLHELFSDAARMRQMARTASDVVERLGGATRNIMQAIEPYLMQIRLGQD